MKDWNYFTLDEMVKSSTAERLKINNTPNDVQIGNLDKLVTMLLDPIREDFGHPIKVTSGFRCEKLNKAVGGVKNSQHMEGKAADIVPIGKDFDKFVAFIKEWLKDKDFDQCILESKGKTRWIHISYDEARNRKKIFSITK